MLDFQKLDPFWNLWSKPNPGISSKMLYPARFNHNLERKIGHEIFVKTEKTEYLSNQLTYAHFDWKFIFPKALHNPFFQEPDPITIFCQNNEPNPITIFLRHLLYEMSHNPIMI